MILPGAEWETVLARARAAAPEAFDSDGQVLNLIEGAWVERGHPKPALSPLDGTPLARLPMVDLETARRAVRFARSCRSTASC
jgi:hypothetical protein